MTFYDIDPKALPKNSIYFHNVFTILIEVSPHLWQHKETEFWFLNQVASSRPTAYCFYLGEEDESDFGVIFVPHSVIEVCGNEVSFYDGVEDTTNLTRTWHIKDGGNNNIFKG